MLTDLGVKRGMVVYGQDKLDEISMSAPTYVCEIQMCIRDRCRVLGFEDSSAGIVSVRLAGFCAVGINGGNIHAGGVDSLCMRKYDSLMDALPLICDERESSD